MAKKTTFKSVIKDIDKHLKNKIILGILVGLFATLSFLVIFQTGYSIGRSMSYMDFTSTSTKNIEYKNSLMDSNTPFQYYTETDSQSIHYDNNKTYVVDVLSKDGHIIILEYNDKDKITDSWELDYFSIGVEVYESYNWHKITDRNRDGSTVKDENGKTVYSHLDESTRTFRFGGIHFGDKYNYLVLAGQRIGWFTDELVQTAGLFSSIKNVVNAPAYRIIKYSKNFKQLDYLDIEYGVQKKVNDGDLTHDIARPLGFATVAMAESSDGKTLVVSTGKEGYDDGSTHHQTALQFIIDIKSWKSTSGIRQNFVSHSLNQYVVYDGNTIVYCDLSDASPHGIEMYIKPESGSRIGLANIHNTPVIGGYFLMHMNLGGVVVGKNSYVVAYNTMDVNTTNTNIRNIMFSTISRDGQTINKFMIEQYSDGVGGGTHKGGQPYIVMMENDQIAILWNEYTSNDTYVTTCYSVVNSDGTILIPTTKDSSLRLNRYACPIYSTKEKLLKWPVDQAVDGEYSRTFYRLKLEG